MPEFEFETIYNYLSASLIITGDNNNRRFIHNTKNTFFIDFHKTNASLRCIYYYDNIKHSRKLFLNTHHIFHSFINFIMFIIHK